MTCCRDFLVCLKCSYEDFDDAFELDPDGAVTLGPDDDTLKCPQCNAGQEYIVSADDANKAISAYKNGVLSGDRD